MANSGGGTILVDVAGDGTLPKLPLAEEIAKHTGVRFESFGIEAAERDGRRVVVITVDPAEMPLVFEKAGTYTDPEGRETIAFNAGTIYVRHGTRSEPARSTEVARIVERQLRRARKEWMAAVRKVVTARPSAAAMAASDVVQSARPDATPIRITADPKAPEYRLVDPDVTHPWRQKELLAEVNARLAPADHINSFDILAVRRIHDVDDNAQFVHRSKFGAQQYSPAFLSWLIEQYGNDADVFRKARDAYKKQRSVAVATTR